MTLVQCLEPDALECRIDTSASDAPRIANVRIPSSALGKVLDCGVASAHAIKLLAIKASKGPGFVLNEHACRKYYATSRWSFQAGVRLAIQRGALVRMRQGRRFATERPLNEGQGGFILIPEHLIKRRPTLIGFVSAILLSPAPVRPARAAARIGVVSAATIRRLTIEALRTGVIEKVEGENGAIFVGRKGCKFDVVKNRPVKNLPVKNRAVHREMEEPHSKMEDTSPFNERVLSYATAFGAGNALKGSFESRKLESLSDSPDWIALKDWRASKGLAAEEFNASTAPNFSDYPSAEQWKEWLCHFSSNVPGHLLRPGAYMQAVEIAHEMKAHWASREFSRADAFHALAVWVAQACEAGRTIRSLGFVAERLLRQLDEEDTSGVHDRPAWYGGDEMARAADLAGQMLDKIALEAPQIGVCRVRLLSVGGLEGLATMIREHGTNRIFDGLLRAIANNRQPTNGGQWWDWTWLDSDINDKPKRRPRKFVEVGTLV